MTIARKKILLRGAYNLYNFGDDIILISWLEFLSGTLKYSDNDIELYLARGHGSLAGLKFDSAFRFKTFELLDIAECFNEKFRRFRFSWRIPSVRDLVKGIKRGNILYIYILLLLAAVSAVDILVYKISGRAVFIGEYLDFFRELDVIHYIGGGYFAGWWPEMLLYEFLVILLAGMINPRLKIIGTGLGLGPFKKGISRCILRMIAKNFSYISVREDCSMKILEDLKITSRGEVLGDDAILLLPRLKDIMRRRRPDAGRYIALNLKNFYGYDYSPLKKGMQDYIEIISSQGIGTGYFCFGRPPGPDDLGVAKIFDERYRDALVIHDPYDEGWADFLSALAGAEAGIGCAYHFNLISVLLKVPVVGIYHGDYYRQKIKNGIEFFTGHFAAMSMDEAASQDLTGAVNAVRGITVDDANLESIYEKMSAEYTKLYKRHVL